MRIILSNHYAVWTAEDRVEWGYVDDECPDMAVYTSAKLHHMPTHEELRSVGTLLQGGADWADINLLLLSLADQATGKSLTLEYRALKNPKPTNVPPSSRGTTIQFPEHGISTPIVDFGAGYSAAYSDLGEETRQYRVVTPNLTVDAVKEVGDEEWAVTFSDRQFPGDYEVKTGKGLSVLKEALWAIELIDHQFGSQWFADVEDPQRARVYARWIDASKIRLDAHNCA